jgi:hypothetical protein
MVFGTSARPNADPWRALRYQLLTAVTGTAIEAVQRQATAAVVIVHEFGTESADRENVAVNAEDFANFVGLLLSVASSGIGHGRGYGPARLAPGAHLHHAVDVFIGKAVFDWQRSSGLPNEPIEPTGSAGGS